MKKAISAILLLFSVFALHAQVTLEDIKKNPLQSANNLIVYPADSIVPLTPAPKGYAPFYIYYIGRHGSRYLGREEEYTRPLKTLQAAHEAGALTAKGEDVLRRMNVIYGEARGRFGALTQVGVEQLHGIAERMYENYPQIFMGDTRIDARSTNVHRVILTMAAWCERIKELNPRLQITRDAGDHEPHAWGAPTPKLDSLMGRGSVVDERNHAIWGASVKSERFEKLLFKKPAKYFEGDPMGPKQLMLQLFNIASDAQSIDLPIEEYGLYDIFTSEELYNLSRIGNYFWYSYSGGSPETRAAKAPMCVPMVNYIIKHAETAIASDVPTATMRFAHDGQIGPLATFLRVPFAYSDEVDPEAISDYYSASDVVPMATNIQFVFFRNEEGDVLVKPLFCEREVNLPAKTDMFPFYKWADMKEYLTSLTKLSE